MKKSTREIVRRTRGRDSAASGNNPQQTLSQVTAKLTNLLRLMFDNNLYAVPTSKADKNFLENLVRHEAGVQGTFAADAMVTRFTADMWKLAQDGGLTMPGNLTDQLPGGTLLQPIRELLNKALIVFAMQKYYDENSGSVGVGEVLFKDVSGGGGIQFDFKAIAASWDKTKDAEKTSYLKSFLDSSLFTATESTLIKSLLPYMRDWYVQAGANGMLATDTLNRGAFMLGGTGVDTLAGGNSADLLVGNAGDDVLSGGQGNDTLLGGVGVDTYAWQAGQNAGIDTILDSDNTGYLRDDTSAPIVLTGGEQYGDNRVFRGQDANGASHLYTFVTGDKTSGGDLIVDGGILVKNYKPGTGNGMGLGFADAAAAPTGLTSLTGNASDNFIGMDVYSRDPNNGSISAATNAAGQTFAGSSNVIGSNADILEGGAGSDILVGGAAGGSRLYADIQIDNATAIANGNNQTGSGLKGDWLAGGDGNDTLVGSTGNDVLMGGGGADLLIGGAGDDYILGDTSAVATSFDWALTNTNGTESFYPALALPAAAGGADVIYAGEGNDHVWGGTGNDVIFGEGGNDRLDGGDGNDILIGGPATSLGQAPDNDILWGGAGNDYLDGGTGVDELQGGAGADILIGGKENDTIFTEGNDTIVYNLGDGEDRITRLDSGSTLTYRFGAGIDPSTFKLREGSLMLDFGPSTGSGQAGTVRMRWRLIAMNDETAHVRRVAA